MKNSPPYNSLPAMEAKAKAIWNKLETSTQQSKDAYLDIYSCGSGKHREAASALMDVQQRLKEISTLIEVVLSEPVPTTAPAVD